MGLGDSTRRDSPTLVDGLKDVAIVDAACGRNHTVFLSDRGVVYAAGDNKMGQLGLGMQSNSVPSPTKVCKLFTFRHTYIFCNVPSSVNAVTMLPSPRLRMTVHRSSELRVEPTSQ